MQANPSDPTGTAIKTASVYSLTLIHKSSCFPAYHKKRKPNQPVSRRRRRDCVTTSELKAAPVRPQTLETPWVTLDVSGKNDQTSGEPYSFTPRRRRSAIILTFSTPTMKDRGGNCSGS
ncbi:hypothetical protein BV898_01968 [Hypsibius exemplaris]|uniref:Uncharacterized protein n=1 Tax=Hypsibius exemplaris TaxID=2072580 RepID=A0A1W0X9R9_HYPEX|nr:hypothetical protein BV898_01968 [Hypsibius exemplaris]